MSTLQFVAIHTYGKEVVADPRHHQRTSAVKCHKVTADLLFALYGPAARDLTPLTTQSYRYLALDSLPELKQDYLVLRLTEAELATVTAHCREVVSHSTYLWRDSRWWEFPSCDATAFRDAATLPTQRYPHFPPTAAAWVTPSQRKEVDLPTPATSGGGVLAEQQGAWWWLTGDTYPHRDTLKAAGARWSRQRIAWFYAGSTLPAAIQALIAVPAATTSTAPPVLPVTEGARLQLRRVVVKHREFVGSTEVIYKLTGNPTAAQRDLLTRHCTWSAVDSCWRYHGETLPDALQAQCEDAPVTVTVPAVSQTVLTPAQHRPLETELAKPADAAPQGDTTNAVAPPPEPPSATTAVTVIPPPTLTLPDCPTDPDVAIVMPPPPTGAVRLSQQYVGALTGSISGDVHCYGYAVHEGVCLYLNMGGPRMAVEAIRAKLAKGEVVNLVPWDAPATALIAGEDKTGMYITYLHTIPEARFTSAILVHLAVTQLEVDGANHTFLFRTDETQAMWKAKAIVTALVTIPVFEAWTPYLWRVGQHMGLLRPVTSGGGVDLAAVSLDAERWTALIAAGLAQRQLRLPVTCA